VALTARLAQAVRRHGAPGAVAGLSRAGTRELAAAGTLTEDTMVRTASITKPIVTFAVLSACAAAGSTVDDRVLDLLPELRSVWRVSPGLTVRQLLDHTGGLRLDVDAAEDLAGTVAAVVGAGPAYRPGTAWRYNNAGYWVAELVLARLAGTGFEEALRQLVLEPAGMTRTGFTPTGTRAGGHAAGTPYDPVRPRGRRASGGLWSTAGDLLSFAEYALGDGSVLLSAALRRPWHAKQRGGRYALGWELSPGPATVAWHDGNGSGFRGRLLVVPAYDFGAVVVTNDSERRGVLDDVLRPELARLPGVRLPSRIGLATTSLAGQTRLALALLRR